MPIRVLILLFAVLLCAAPLGAAVYKYVDASGKVHFTDTPPSGAAAEQMSLQPNVYQGPARPAVQPESGAGGEGEPQLSPAELRKQRLLEAQRFPKVELFVTIWCGYCDRAKAYLRKRGIPFQVYDIEEDLAAARRKASLTNRRGVPFALIGDQKVVGFSEALYDRAFEKARR